MHLLVIRTSAMGDVALTTPVLKGIRQQFPEVSITLLTRRSYSPFFSTIDGLKLFFPEFNGRHKGLPGLVRLFRDLKKDDKIDYVIDLHDVLRTKVLDVLFRLSGIPVKVIDKGRREKRALITGKSKKKLKHSVERYMDVFTKAGYSVQHSPGPWIVPEAAAITEATRISGIGDGINIGVAPYAKHELKLWPEENMVTLLNIILKKTDARFFLFGGADESESLESFQKKVPGAVNLSGKLKLAEELALMGRLTFMIAMDSSNMHMAALVGTKVISIWGATDPLAGFGAWMQPEKYVVSIPVDELTCRPCTIYGNGECWRGDHACMEWLTPKMVYDRIREAGLLG